MKRWRDRVFPIQKVMPKNLLMDVKWRFRWPTIINYLSVLYNLSRPFLFAVSDMIDWLGM